MSNPPDDHAKDQDASAPLLRADSSFDDRPGAKKSEPSASIPAAPSLIQPGATLESRFRIVRLLGRGGMGEVYEAEDLVLKENVALKTLLPQVATDEHFRERFRREVLLARKVTHPNVCRIFEVFGDASDSAIREGITSLRLPFMTMELLRGKTLTQFLLQSDPAAGQAAAEGKKRRLPAQEALPLASQMVAALEAAHQVGVVHRDFKSSNVFLATRAGSPQARVVVTDFGLARLSEVDDAGHVSFTGPNEMVGTPLYMAPEQVEGGEITAATDIYALGVVLYEMVTGTWPFVGKTARETASLRLKTKPAPPKTLVPALDEKWNAVILRCLERDPADRFHSVTEVRDALEGETVALRRRTQEQRLRVRKTASISVAVVFTLAVALAIYHWWPRPITTGNRTSLAVVGFQNLSQMPDKNWIGSSLQGTLTRELAASDGLRVSPAEDVARMRQDLALSSEGVVDKTNLDKVQTNLSVDDLLLGDYELSGPPEDHQIRVNLRIIDPSRSAEPVVLTVSGRESELFALSDNIARSVRAKLNVGDINAADRSRLLAELPETNAASRAYFDGLEKLSQFDPLGAKDDLTDAVQKTPDAPLPHFALSQAWDILGYDKEALSEAKLAQATSQRLSKPEQREIECRALELQRKDWESAIAACRGVWQLRKRLGDGLRLADVQFSAERWDDALTTLASLKKQVPAPENSDPRIDLAEARTEEALTRYQEMEKSAQAAREKASKQAAKLFEAQALSWSCVAKLNTDKPQEAKDDCTMANDIFSTVGDKIGQARTLTNLAHVLSQLKDTTGASAKYNEALRLATSVGSARDQCDALLNLGAAFDDMNQFPQAAEKYSESLKIGEKSGNLGCQARATENLGVLDRDQHNFDGAREKFDKAGKLFSQLSMISDLARLQSNTGDLLWQQGDPAGARANLEAAASSRRKLGLRDRLGLTLPVLGDVLLAQDELDKARAAYNEATDIKNSLGEGDEAKVLAISLARVSLEKGDAAAAEMSARQLAGWFAEKKDPDNEVFARDVLIQALLAQQKNADCVKEAQSLESLLPKLTDADTRFSARITLARVLAAQHAYPRAFADIRTIAAEARKGSYLMQELSANLALAESEKLQGARANSSELQHLAQTAKSKGYLLLARKADALLDHR